MFFPGSVKAEPEDIAKNSDVSTLSVNSNASVLSEATCTQTPAPSDCSSPIVGDNFSKRLSSSTERPKKLKQSDALDGDTETLRLSTSTNDFWHGQVGSYALNSTQTSVPPAQNENIARRYHSQQGDTLSSPMSDQATSDIEATAFKQNLSVAHTLGVGTNGPSYRNDTSQSMLLPHKSQSQNVSYSTSADDIQSGNGVAYGIDATTGIQKPSVMAGDATAMGHDGERTSQRSKSIDLYHPSVGQPLNPRDHSLLERIYNEMHADRFINLMPLSIFSMVMDMICTRKSTH